MLFYTVKRLGMALLVAFTVSFLTFALLYVAGDPATAILGPNATDVDIAYIRKHYGFDQPLLVQFIQWLGRIVQGDLGYSYFFQVPVSDILLQRLPITIQLGLLAFSLALLIALPLGIAAAARPNSLVDRLALFLSVAGQAIPSFWMGLMMIVIFSVNLGLLPSSGNDSWRHFILPTVVLGYYATPAIMRLTRSSMLEVLSSDYVRTAKSKGLSRTTVLYKHALRNAVIPVVSLAAAQLGFMLAGSVVIESVFSLQGAGMLAWQSISRGDLPTVQAIVLLFSIAYVALTLLADLFNAWLDPQVRMAQ
ncbi:ABC transporter permease [Sneathiella chinensis]|uniref:Peptide ABC transporter permease n=1 Tax=Sneathiella chinensis TaxID=349750 RepID=A0ABQ5U1K4_9PROT|nr:ABC transporter permease [Sneathiella chinensis]GLQ05163.1 peptide ABC transporter permease [Sneathiella chinensis]